MVGDNTKNNNKNSIELEASIASAESEVGALAKADQKHNISTILQNKFLRRKIVFSTYKDREMHYIRQK